MIGTVAFGVYAAVGWWSAARGVDPEAPELSDRADLALRALNLSVTGSAFNPAYLASGPAHLLVYGPHCMQVGRERLSTLLPADDRMLAATSDLLARLGKAPMPLASVEPKMAAVVLLRVGFAKFDGSGSTTLVATIRGREAMSVVGGT